MLWGHGVKPNLPMTTIANMRALNEALNADHRFPVDSA